MAQHLRRIISTPVLPSMGLAGMGLTASNGPFSSFSSTSEHSNAIIYQDINGQAVSLPPTRSASPSQFDADSVEVVTKSTVERNNLYDLDVLLKPLASGDDEDGHVREDSDDSKCSSGIVEPPVKVMGLGFITNMAEYMVATDVLVTKAGPGTIAEAASLSLPIMLTSFLPGQEEGNVDYVVEGEFGAFVSDSDPQAISDVVATWLMDSEKLREMSNKARLRGKPDAAAEIVDAIGESALRWKHGSEEIEVLEEKLLE